jgi:hypothetical protein
MTQRCRLLVRAQMNGGICEPGHLFDLADGELGPHKTVIHAHERLDIANDAQRLLPDYVDEPLYEVWDDTANLWVKPQTGGAKS